MSLLTTNLMHSITDNLWVGLHLMYHLFVREHNRICDMLKENYPGYTDQELFDKARLINSAVMSKIHVGEWTPALLSSPLFVKASSVTWPGIKGDFGWLGDLLGKLFKNHPTLGYTLNGIPGSPRELHDVPFSITEEFVAAYRLHPLIPDTIYMNNYLKEQRKGNMYDLPDFAFNKSFTVID